MAKVGIISLGCPRNLVDSEVILGSLKKEGFEVGDIEKGVDVAVINTCSFIESAKEESIETILQVLELKKDGKVQRLVVSGCLPQLYKDKLLKELPSIDLIVGTSDLSNIGVLIKELGVKAKRSAVSGDLNYLYDEYSPRFALTPRHYAYVKVSEGCDNLCSYCIISRLRGRFRSRSIESVLEEIKALSEDGFLKEINLIGQDTTLFGMDRYGKPQFSELLKKICALENSVKWVRILYTHPAHYTDELISAIKEEEKICRYLDLPIQHINDKILKSMNRKTTNTEIIRLIDKLRKDIPGMALRTSVIVGFPGETDEDFRELMAFLKETRFERLGAFIYSKEEGTKASRFKDQIPEKVKKTRFDEVMKLQQSISSEINRSFLGKTVEALIDEKIEGEKNKFLGRTEGDAPEVDGSVYVSGENLKIGEFYNVKITDTLEYDLVGEAA